MSATIISLGCPSQCARCPPPHLQVDRQWYGPPQLWVRDDASGVWQPTYDYPPKALLDSLALPKRAPPQLAAAAAAPPAANGAAASPDAAADATPDTAAAAAAAAAYEARMRSCMCLVDIDIPLVALSDGVHSRSFAGNGLVVHHSDTLGLVLVDRNTVAIGSCDVNVSTRLWGVGGSVMEAGRGLGGRLHSCCGKASMLPVPQCL